MAFSLTWNAAFEADPADTDQLSEGALRLRNLKEAIRERMEVGGLDWDADGMPALGGVSFPAGTKMLFQQTAAPTLWTKDTTHDNKALRVVSGAVGSGGATEFTTVFGSGKTAGDHAITVAEMPEHDHDVVLVRRSGDQPPGAAGPGWGADNITASDATATSETSGSGDTHNHTLSLDLQYVDLIIATKD